MGSLKPSRNPIVLRKGTKIGAVAAENDDEFLFDCFVENSASNVCLDINDPGMVLDGRTGSGKTAILRFVSRRVENFVFVDPVDMSMHYVSNSDSLRFVQAIGGDLHLLFLALWKHVLCLEYIRLRYKITDEEKSLTVVSRLFERFGFNPRKQRALRYLREWEGKFWITMDQNIKELTERVESKLATELGGEIDKFVSKGQYEKQLSKEKKSELVSRAKKIISQEQLTDLSSVIEIMAEDAEQVRMSLYYILIDRLDEHWADNSIKYTLIQALIEALKAFRKIQNLKILVSLRSDIIQHISQSSSGFQPEKFEDYIIRVKWNKEHIKQLLDKRIHNLFKRKYSSQCDFSFYDMFPQKVGTIETLNYICDRTLLRPRDVIMFVNLCFEHAEGKFEISAKIIRDVEDAYSKSRLQALLDEWKSTYPNIKQIIDSLKYIRKSRISVSEMAECLPVNDLAISFCTSERGDNDPLYQHACRAIDNDTEMHGFCKQLLCILYRIGAIGVKIGSIDRYRYSYIDSAVISESDLGPGARFHVHPMLHRAMGITDQS